MATDNDGFKDTFGANYALALSRVLDVVANLEALVESDIIDAFSGRSVATQVSEAIRNTVNAALAAEVTYMDVLREAAAGLGVDL